MEVSVGPPIVSTHFNDEFVVCELSAEMSSTKEQGYFAADTRFVSGYRLKLGGDRPILLNAAAVADHSARFEFTNPPIVGADGTEVREHSIHLRLDRSVGPGVHEDYDVTNHGRERIIVDLEVSLESDFADLFDVKAHRRIRRGSIHSAWDETRGALTTRYQNGTFARAFVVEAHNASSRPEFANGGLLFRVELEPKASWHACLWWTAVVDGDERRVTRPCDQLLASDLGHEAARRRWVGEATIFETSNENVTAALRQAVDDLAALRLHRHDQLAAAKTDDDPNAWVPAAGIPWFVSLFGRDALTVSFQSLAISPRFALGSLRALAALQADSYDDSRDMQPGKIEHEIRHGELAALHLVPHTPYYGTHDATTLYVLVAALAWRWHGDRGELIEVRPHVERALQWIAVDGDPDHDGLQEYQTRAPNGYYNQGWKDSKDGIPAADGSAAKLPIALCEHQGLVVAAKRAWASVLEEAFGEDVEANRLRVEADRLAAQIEERFWWEEEGTYYLGLDGDKRPIESVASNPGQLLWQRVVDPARARVSCDASSPTTCGAAGASARSPASTSPTTRSRISSDRCGRTTTRSSRRAAAPTDSTSRRRRSPRRSSTRRRCSPTNAPQSSSRDSQGMPVGSRSSTSARTSRRPGPRGRSSTSSRRSSDSRRTPRRGPCSSARRFRLGWAR